MYLCLVNCSCRVLCTCDLLLVEPVGLFSGFVDFGFGLLVWFFPSLSVFLVALCFALLCFMVAACWYMICGVLGVKLGLVLYLCSSLKVSFV